MKSRRPFSRWAVILSFSFLGMGCSKAIEFGSHHTVGSFDNLNCELPVGVSGSPQNFEEMVEVINALPRPLSLGCFINSLDRPLKLIASASQLSAQPAESYEIPRIFILSGPLVMGLVPSDLTRHRVELSLLDDEGNSIKGAVSFPVLSRLERSTPYESVREGNGTTCRLCHNGEVRVPEITHAEAFKSIAFSPSPFSIVSLELLKEQSAGCNARAEPERCGILKALFYSGEFERGEFPDGI